ncbi:lipase family protein [Nocardia sp. NPDC058633]|uniref:lipase family protein n=1 Tax=Nocardia sp. NPDC058633 TaxID=3346568 RepID=UPI00364E5236
MTDTVGQPARSGASTRRYALPWWVAIVVGLACTAIGLVLVGRPLTSVTLLAVLLGIAAVLTGVADLIDARQSATPRTSAALGALWIVFGAVVLVRLGQSIELLAPAFGVALLIGGAVRLSRAARGGVDQRLAVGIFAVAEIVLGVLALRWLDLTLLALALLFGLRAIVFGIALIVDGVSRAFGWHREVPVRTEPTGPARFGRVAVAVLALVVAVGAAGVGAQVRQDSPTVDAFYDAPAQVPAAPGVLLRSEPFTRGIPESAIAWRILYTTTRDDGVPALASGLVMVPKQPSDIARPVIAWAHGTTGYARQCAPTLVADPLTAGALPAREQILANGWALVATDYPGLGTAGPQPYLIGQGEGRSVLDAVRAARGLTEIRLADRTVVWGHSQGGHAALWAGLLAPTYAPDAGVTAIAAMAPAADITGLTRHLPDVPGGSVFASFVAAAYADTYSDIDLDAYITAPARTLVREMAQRCLSEPGVLASVLSALSISHDRSIFRTDPTTGPLGVRITANIPTGTMTPPLLLAQGADDPLVEPSIQDSYVAARCRDRWNLDYRVYPDRDHLSVVADYSPLIPDLLTWTTQRLTGAPPTPNC